MTDSLDATLLHVIRAIFGYLLLLFVPGYAISWALYPRADQIRFIARIAYSCVLSIASVIVTVLVIDLLFGMDTTPLNIVLPLLAITLVAALLWVLQNLYGQSRMKNFIGSLPGRPSLQKLASVVRRAIKFIGARIPQETVETDGKEIPAERVDTSLTTIYPPGMGDREGQGEVSPTRTDGQERPAEAKKGSKDTNKAAGDTIRDEDLFED